ncbi:MAG: hypothetical protein HY080_05480 [Gammaproteobacteria bacterium]|nr:hypothetical protein [Gammaproteobacteria bacterium]
MKTQHTISSITIGILLLSLGGCASMQPLSNLARSGDTVTISLGGTDSNALTPILKKEEVSVTITDAAGRAYPVKLRNLFRVYSDPTSHYDYVATGSDNQIETYVSPHQGQWMAVLDLVDPVSAQPLPLAAGQANFAVSSPKLQTWVDYPGYGWKWTNGDLSAIPIEIITGNGAPNPLNYLTPVSYSPLNGLEPEPQVEITATGIPSNLIGGGMFVFKYVIADFVSGNPRVTTTTPDPNVQLASHNLPQGDGTALLKVMISNPHGFNLNNSKLDANGVNTLRAGQSLLRSLRFSIAWDSSNNAVSDTNWQNSISLVSGRYVDLNGNTMSELAPVVTKIR